MPEVLLDSSTYIDLERANRDLRLPWATTALRHALSFRTTVGTPSISIITVIEILNGLDRDTDPAKSQTFKQQVGTSFNVIDLDSKIGYLTAQIMARLETAGNGIGLADSIIAATALQAGLYSRHVERATFPTRPRPWLPARPRQLAESLTSLLGTADGEVLP